MKMKWTTIAMTLFVVTAFASAGFAFGPGGRGHEGMGKGRFQEFHGAAGLGLTAEQTAKIRDLKEKHWKEVQPIREKMFGKRGELRLLWLQQAPDKDRILAVQKEMQELRGQMQEKMTSHRLVVFNDVLTPEQRTKVQAFGARGGFGGGHGFYGRGMEGKSCAEGPVSAKKPGKGMHKGPAPEKKTGK